MRMLPPQPYVIVVDVGNQMTDFQHINILSDINLDRDELGTYIAHVLEHRQATEKRLTDALVDIMMGNEDMWRSFCHMVRLITAKVEELNLYYSGLSLLSFHGWSNDKIVLALVPCSEYVEELKLTPDELEYCGWARMLEKGVCHVR